ncbi:hypothetical protein MJO28_005503 [Puccinia striiformis f. sp. tritici]|uniref:Uncharacterized protein n=1 Tax=Puccinia striiformis f. sp. tritici TaxID=168172 RepID=A0ACC0EKW5_9BASI|nr:hypothetical protein MJO28_005503 [Puccinia striiformis f. sp. tritici]
MVNSGLESFSSDISDEVWVRYSPGPSSPHSGISDQSATMLRLTVLLTSDALTWTTRNSSSGLSATTDIEHRSTACPLKTCPCSDNPGTSAHQNQPVSDADSLTTEPNEPHPTSTEPNEFHHTSTEADRSQLSEGEKSGKRNPFNACDIQVID